MCAITCEEFIEAAIDFLKTSDRIGDGWKFHKNDVQKEKSYLRKETFIQSGVTFGYPLLKTEYVIFYNQSYGVPSFSFNIWEPSGALVTLESLRNMSFISIKQEDFYSVITQQEHPIFFRPYFLMHPCHSAELLKTFKGKSKNIIVTFLGLITPLIRLKLPYEFGS